MERLQKILAHKGIASRRKSEELILEGKVKVNGQVVKELGVKVDPNKDHIEVEGVKLGQDETKVYIMLNKPTGYVTTVKDPHGRKKVTDLLEGVKERVYPVGRLDYETEGLLLLTNDGELTYALTHPKHQIVKTYLAKVKEFPSKVALEKLRKGIVLQDGLTAPAKVRFIKKLQDSSLIEIKIHEGKNRQVRRMFEFIGHPVIELKRVKLAFLTLEGLEVGKFRYLTDQEVKKLKEMAIL